MHETKHRNSSIDALFDTVVAGGYCIGCGACAVARPAEIGTAVDRFGRIQVVPLETLSRAHPASTIDAQAVCPFSSTAMNEDEIGRRRFTAIPSFTPKIGRWTSCHAGYVTEDDYRECGASGGMGSWLLAELLRRGLVDAVLHVKPTGNPSGDLLFEYQVSRTVDEVRGGAKSRYYPCDFSSVLQHIDQTPGRYALVALPCFSKAARLLAAQNQTIAERLRFVIALVCGHLKSTGYARMYAWQAGVMPEDLRYIDFRHKGPGETARQYFIKVVGDRDGERVETLTDNKAFFGTDWGHGFFKYQACDYCDDILGETADVSIGDAWLPKYVPDPGGTNVIVSRNRGIDDVLASAMAEGRLWLEPLRTEDVIRSQEAGFRHRHDGLAYRLLLKDRRGLWRPPKRIAPGASHLTLQYRLLFRLREIMRDESHRAFLAAVERRDFSVFVRRMRPLLASYDLVKRYVGVRAWKRCVGQRVRWLRARLATWP
jgi:coenzyme F420 hydrogenase subunit beta